MRASIHVALVQGVPPIVFIVDMDGPVSITNDAEAVVKHLNDKLPRKQIIYRDSQGEWSELAHEDGRFTGFRQYDGMVPQV